MNKTDQMPVGGCNQCGAFAGETQSYKQKRLVWDGTGWTCRACQKANEKTLSTGGITP